MSAINDRIRDSAREALDLIGERPARHRLGDPRRFDRDYRRAHAAWGALCIERYLYICADIWRMMQALPEDDYQRLSYARGDDPYASAAFPVLEVAMGRHLMRITTTDGAPAGSLAYGILRRWARED